MTAASFTAGHNGLPTLALFLFTFAAFGLTAWQWRRADRLAEQLDDRQRAIRLLAERNQAGRW